MKSLSSFFTGSGRHLSHGLGFLAAAALLTGALGCGSDSTSTPTPPPVGSTAVQLNMGDAPADWLLAFSMNTSSLALKNAAGQTVAITSDSVPVEMIHRMGTMEPVAVASVPQGTYTGASLTVASCKLIYLDKETEKLVLKSISGPIDVTIPFASSVELGTTPLAFNFDLDLDHSLTVDGSGAFQFSPQFHFAAGAMNSSNGSTSAVNPRYGGMYQVMGIVNAASASSFSITPVQAGSMLTFGTNAETKIQGRISTMAQLGVGMGVLVTATIQADGSLLARHIRAVMGAGGAMGGGIITSVTGMPATQLTVVMQNGAGASINTDYLSNTLTVNLTENTNYEIDTDRVSLEGLPFVPMFDASHIFAGQSVLPLSEDAVVPNPSCTPTCGTLTASLVRQREQGLRGTTDVAITPGSTTSFTLTLPAECAFTTLTGATEVIVYQQAATNVEQTTPIAAGTTLRVHGLLFNNGGQWVLVASTIASV